MVWAPHVVSGGDSLVSFGRACLESPKQRARLVLLQSRVSGGVWRLLVRAGASEAVFEQDW